MSIFKVSHAECCKLLPSQACFLSFRQYLFPSPHFEMQPCILSYSITSRVKLSPAFKFFHLSPLLCNAALLPIVSPILTPSHPHFEMNPCFPYPAIFTPLSPSGSVQYSSFLSAIFTSPFDVEMQPCYLSFHLFFHTLPHHEMQPCYLSFQQFIHSFPLRHYEMQPCYLSFHQFFHTPPPPRNATLQPPIRQFLRPPFLA
jgi:hypothetical protein